MRDSGVAVDLARAVELSSGLAAPEQRSAALSALAELLGCDGLLVFTPDPELGVLLPVPGLPQTLRPARPWRDFLDRFDEEESTAGSIPTEGGAAVPVFGTRVDGGAVVVTTGRDAIAELAGTRALFTLLGSIVRGERAAAINEAKAGLAAEAVARVEEQAATLRTMREQIEKSLVVEEEARAIAREEAERAAALAEELQSQAALLQEQTAELENLNAELHVRTREAETAREWADAANRAKSEFLATMSHELRTPINAIIGYTEILGLGIPGTVTPEQQVHLNRVKVSGMHLLTLINDVLDLAKIEAGELRTAREGHDVEVAVRESMELLALHAAESDVRVTDECSGTSTPYFGDEDRVRQIVTNLLSNAVKFTPAGGSVTLRCGRSSTPPDGVHVDGGGPWAFVDVVDTGIGIRDEDVIRVFQAFGQANAGRNPSHGGTGLGLTISRQLARLMGGDLVVRSRFGEGATFTLWLPTALVPQGTVDDAIRIRPPTAAANA